MNDHFHAFSFVDRITSIDPGVRISGTYTIPADVCFPMMLVAEAIGQCSAWMGMPALDFKYRPVAGIVARYEQYSHVKPGQVLELSGELIEVTPETLAYNGTASVDGVLVARMERSIAPMLPMEEFDDPAAVLARFELLCGEGARAGGFRGVPLIPMEVMEQKKGVSKKASLSVPGAASFFGDHFPRRPVFPGALLMGKTFEMVNSLLAEVPPSGSNGVWRLRTVQNTKFRSFTPPDSTLECEARIDGLTDAEARVSVEIRDQKRMVASAKALFVAETA
jgi:3-hydroxymyristoyl/3-hydroxydecanoyl-(acyl carrier protein) dehydratase